MNQARVAEQVPVARPKRETLKLGSKLPARSAVIAPHASLIVPSAPQLFALGRLMRAPENVRHTRIDEDCEELADDIVAHGLLQSLIGYEDGNNAEIVGGGRRLRGYSSTGLNRLSIGRGVSQSLPNRSISVSGSLRLRARLHIKGGSDRGKVVRHKAAPFMDGCGRERRRVAKAGFGNLIHSTD